MGTHEGTNVILKFPGSAGPRPTAPTTARPPISTTTTTTKPKQAKQAKPAPAPTPIRPGAVDPADAPDFARCREVLRDIGVDEKQDILACIPPDGFVFEHVAYTAQATDAPVIYAVGTALATLAGWVADRAYLSLRGFPHPLHIWVMLTGRSTVDRKTTAARIGPSELRAVDPTRLIPAEGSPEGRLEHLAEHPCGLLYYGEFARFLSELRRSYSAGLSESLMDLYDHGWNQTFHKKLVSRRDKSGATEPVEVVIENPRVSFLTACALSLLESHSRPTDWTGGFFRRMLLLHSSRTRWFDFPVLDRAVEARLARLLRATVPDVPGAEAVEVQVLESALDLYRPWAHALDTEARGAPEVVSGLLGDAPMRALRVAALYALSCRRQVVDVATMQQAINLIDLSCATTRGTICAAAASAGDPGQLLQARILRVLGGTPEGLLSTRDLMRRLHVDKGKLDRALDNLVEEEVVAKNKPAMGKRGRPKIMISLVKSE